MLTGAADFNVFACSEIWVILSTLQQTCFDSYI